jgi:hypothetical protein
MLCMLLGFISVYGLVVNGLLRLDTFHGRQGWQTSVALLFNLLVVGTIWGVSRIRPSPARAALLLFMLGLIALQGMGALAALLANLNVNDYRGIGNWKTQGLILGNVLVIIGAIAGMVVAKPWRAMKPSGEPVSPSTRRTQLLFGLSGVISVVAVVIVIIGAQTNEGVNPVWSNSRNLPHVIAFAAVAIWLLSVALAWWWYASADEHERKANDVGFLFGGGLFMAATPVWWILSRAGLVPPPDAMVLWYATMVAMGIGWAWYRNR